MRPAASVAVFVVSLLAAACGDGSAAAPADAPPELAPFLPKLEAMAATLTPPDEATQKELQELADIALSRVEVDPRTHTLAERALLEHEHAWFVLEPALLDDNPPAVRSRAAWLCGQTGRPELQAALVLRLKYELDREAVLWVADALQRLGNDSGLGFLDGAMAVTETAQQAGGMAIEVCRERGIALSEQPTWAELQGHLRELLATWRRTGVSTRRDFPAPSPAARAALEARFAAHLKTTQGWQLRPVDDARFVTTRCGVLPVPLLVRTLSAAEPYLRTEALEVLADLGLPGRAAAEPVRALLADPLTGAYAVRTLGQIGATEAIPAIRKRLTSPDVEQRAAAVQALGLLGDAPSAEALRLRLADEDEAFDVRVGAAFGLLCLGENAAAEAFLDTREQQGDYHAPTLARLRERLQAHRRR